MKILVLPAKRHFSIDEIKNFSGLWQHYLIREFQKAGHEVICEQGADVRWPKQDIVAHWEKVARRMHGAGIDHALGFSRHFSRIPAVCADIMRKAVSGCVAQVHDCPLASHSTDVTFSIAHPGKFQEGHHHIGWAADDVLLTPKQSREELRILIDHPLYHEGMDTTASITDQALAYVESGAWRGVGFKMATVRRLCDGGVMTVERGGKPPAFNREHIPFKELLPEYNVSHLFLPTHRESLGLTVLETAMAGALPVCAEGYIRPDLLSSIRALTYKGPTVPWDEAVRAFDAKASRAAAIKNNWTAVAGRILKYFEGFKR